MGNEVSNPVADGRVGPNQSTRTNFVSVSWFKGLTANTSPVGLTSLAIPPDFSVDFGSRSLPDALTALDRSAIRS
jgi:hypothetical protein